MSDKWQKIFYWLPRIAKNIHLLIDLIKERENIDDRKGEFDSNRTYSTFLGIDVAHYQKNN